MGATSFVSYPSRVHGSQSWLTAHSPLIVYSQNTFDLNYPDLSRWIKTIHNGPKACYVAFGPGLSYFACAAGFSSIWAGIPTELSDKVQKAFDTPCQVSLGIDNAWFVMWPDGYYSWKFYGGYGALDKILDAAEPRTVSVSRTKTPRSTLY